MLLFRPLDRIPLHERVGRLSLLVLLAALTACGGPAAPPAVPDRIALDSDERLEGAPEVARPSDLNAEPSGLAIPEFELTDQLGQPYGSKDLVGNVWVANFIFTRCTATCPRQTEQIAKVQQHALRWPDAERVRLVSFTVDPERDTVEQLKNYAQRNGANDSHWKFLRGGREEIWSLSKDVFKLPISQASAEQAPVSGPVAHSSRFILVDAQMRIRGVFDGLSDEDFGKLLLGMRALLSEPAAGVTTTHVAIPGELFDPLWRDERRAAQLKSRDSLDIDTDFEFTDQLQASGIRFVSGAVADAARDFKPNHYDHATGVAVADIDNDGLLDLYFASEVGGNQLWRNLGDGRFEDVTVSAGVGLADRVGASASFADTDNDGDADLFVTSIRGGNVLFINDGQGNFHDATEKSGLAYEGHSSSAEFFDFDNDGLLDLYVTNVGKFTTNEIGYSGDRAARKYPYYVGLKEAFAGHLNPKLSEASLFYRNVGDNRFEEVSKAVGLADMGWNGDATPIDANADGWQDLYVLNMQGNDTLYLNRGGTKFERADDALLGRPVWGGMGVKSFDYNNDGLLDLFVTNMHVDMWEMLNGQGEKEKRNPGLMPESYLKSRQANENVLGNALYQNLGEGRFKEVSDAVGAETYWPWGVTVADLNADGYLDAFLPSSMSFPYRYHANSLLLNDRGREFRDAEYLVGVEPRRNGTTAIKWFELDCDGVDKGCEQCMGRTGKVVVWGALGSRSSVIFDYDNDGDLDIITNDFNAPPMVLQSDLAARRGDKLHWLKVSLRGTAANRDGLGATVRVITPSQTLTRVQDGQSGYLSQSRMPLYFGLGADETIESLHIRWPGGEEQTVPGPIPVNQSLTITQVSPTGAQ